MKIKLKNKIKSRVVEKRKKRKKKRTKSYRRCEYWEKKYKENTWQSTKLPRKYKTELRDVVREEKEC